MVENVKPIWSLWEMTELEVGIGKFGLNRKSLYCFVDMLRTARTAAEMHSAEKHLDTLWDTID